MSSHHRSGGPPSLMDDVHDFDRNFHSHRFENNRGGRGNRGAGNGGGMRGRGGGEGGGMRGRGDGGFVPRGAPRGGRGDFHQRDRFNNNFNRPNDDQRSVQSKMPSLLDVDQQQPRPFDRDNNRNGGRGRMPYPRGGGGGGRDFSADDRFHPSGSKPNSSDGPPPLLDFGNDKSGLSTNASNNSLPSLLSVPVEDSGIPPPGSDSNKALNSHKDYPHGDNSQARSDSHSSHRDNDNRYHDRDSHRSNRGDFNRSSSFHRDRSRSPRDRDRDRHGPPRDDFRRGGRGGGGRGAGDNFSRGGRGDHHSNQREPHQSRFGPDNNQQPWQDRRGGARGGSRGGGFHDRQRDMSGHQRPNEQLPPDNRSFHHDGRSNFDAAPSQNRPFPEGYSHGNFDSMGAPPHNRSNLHPSSNFNQAPPQNRPDFYPSNANNSPYQQHNSRPGGRPSRFSDRQDDYEDDRPLTKPPFSLPNATATTTPLYINQPNNPTFSQPRPTMSSTFSSQQPPPAMYPQGGPTHNQPPPSQFGWPNQQQQQPPGAPNSTMAQSLLSLAGNDQHNPNLSGHPSSNNFYGNNNDFHRQQQQQQPIAPSANPYYGGGPAGSSQAGVKPHNVNAQPNPMSMPPQQMPPAAATNNAAAAAAANASNMEAWQQYYQQCWQYMQQQQQAGVQPPVTQMGAQQQFPQSQTGTKQTNNAPTGTTSAPNAAANQANAEAWAQYWVQCQAYMQQQQQTQPQAPSSSNPVTIAAPSQLYAQTGNKSQTSAAANSNSSTGVPPVSNRPNWMV